MFFYGTQCSAVIMPEPLREFTQFMRWTQHGARWPPTFGPSQVAWATGPPMGSQLTVSTINPYYYYCFLVVCSMQKLPYSFSIVNVLVSACVIFPSVVLTLSVEWREKKLATGGYIVCPSNTVCVTALLCKKSCSNNTNKFTFGHPVQFGVNSNKKGRYC